MRPPEFQHQYPILAPSSFRHLKKSSLSLTHSEAFKEGCSDRSSRPASRYPPEFCGIKRKFAFGDGVSAGKGCIPAISCTASKVLAEWLRTFFAFLEEFFQGETF